MGGFGKGFGKVLGGGCDLLGVSWGTFFPMGDGEKHIFPHGGPKRPRGGHGVDLERFWEGSASLRDVKIDVFGVFAAHIAQDNMKQHKIA